MILGLPACEGHSNKFHSTTLNRLKWNSNCIAAIPRAQKWRSQSGRRDCEGMATIAVIDKIRSWQWRAHEDPSSWIQQCIFSNQCLKSWVHPPVSHRGPSDLQQASVVWVESHERCTLNTDVPLWIKWTLKECGEEITEGKLLQLCSQSVRRDRYLSAHVFGTFLSNFHLSAAFHQRAVER